MMMAEFLSQQKHQADIGVDSFFFFILLYYNNYNNNDHDDLSLLSTELMYRIVFIGGNSCYYWQIKRLLCLLQLEKLLPRQHSNAGISTASGTKLSYRADDDVNIAVGGNDELLLFLLLLSLLLLFLFGCGCGCGCGCGWCWLVYNPI